MYHSHILPQQRLGYQSKSPKIALGSICVRKCTAKSQNNYSLALTFFIVVLVAHTLDWFIFLCTVES